MTHRSILQSVKNDVILAHFMRAKDLFWTCKYSQSNSYVLGAINLVFVSSSTLQLKISPRLNI
jgi:hypothetical protein